MSFLDLIQPNDDASVRSRVTAYLTAAGLRVADWIVGGVGGVAQQMSEALIALSQSDTSIVAKAIRGFGSLDLSVDPGDEDPYDAANATLEPAPGFLSAMGENVFGTTRGAATFASGAVTFTNSGSIARTITPGSLTFTWTSNSPPTPPPTYRNTADVTVYTEPGPSITVDAGASIVLPVTCDTIGAQGSCPSGSLSLTTTLLGCSATNALPVVGQDRQAAQFYRDACRAASARLTFATVEDAIKYFATHNPDGSTLLNASGFATGITRVWVSQSSTTGVVQVYYASATGAPLAEDVTAANRNVELYAMLFGDCLTFSGLAATEFPVAVVGTVRVKARAGLSTPAIQSGVITALADAWPLFPIGGLDPSAGIGRIYASDIEAIARSGYPGLYHVAVSTPAGSSVAIPAGQVATLVSSASDWTVVVT